MSTLRRAPGDHDEIRAGAIVLRYRPAGQTNGQAQALASRLAAIVHHVERRLKPLRDPWYQRAPVVVTFDGESNQQVSVELAGSVDPADPESDEPDQTLETQVALRALERRVGGPELWRAPIGGASTAAGECALHFLCIGLARYLVASALGESGQPLFGSTVETNAPRQSADQICRQAAADRDGRVPLYESFMRRGGEVASPPEYLALAEAFSGYLFEREGAKAYLRLVRGACDDPNETLELVYGKSFEELQDEWLAALLRGQSRRAISIPRFAVMIMPYLRPYRVQVVGVLALIVLQGLVTQVAPFILRDLTDIAAQAYNKGNPEIFPDTIELWGAQLLGQGVDVEAYATKHAVSLDALRRLYTKVGILLLVSFVNLCTLVWLIYSVNVVGQNILRDLRIRLTDRLHHLGADFYARHRMGDMVARFTSDIARMADPLADAAAYSVYYMVFIVFTVVAMIFMSWQLSLVLFLIVPAYYIVNTRFGPTMQAAWRTRQERLAQLNSSFVEMLYGNSLIKSYGLADHLLGEFRPKVSEMRKIAIWTDFLNSFYREILGIVENFQVKIVLAVGGTLAVFGQVTVGTIIGFNSQMVRFIGPLHKLGVIYGQVAIIVASLRRVEEILREPVEMMATPPGGTYAPDGVQSSIEFEGVSFSYTAAERTLADINLTIPTGRKVAFVGPTGAGKSTLASLLPRFYDVEQGAVRIDGRDIRSFSLAGLRESISIVSQDTFLFNSTILDNIRFGRLGASDAEVVEAARQARLDAFVATLPAGYHTIVGERGGRLSGGQRQRVAIARALLRNSPILILDEATSALDAETESEILHELDEVTQGKTVISITHRLGLAIKSDHICVLQAGRIVQQGSHEVLIHQPGLYRKLFEDQNQELMERTRPQAEAEPPEAQGVPTFRMVSNGQLNGLSKGLPTERYAAGDLLRSPDSEASQLYLLRAGTLELTLSRNGGTVQHLTIGVPDSEDPSSSLSVLLDLPRDVPARALTPIEVNVVATGDLQLLLKSRSSPASGSTLVESGNGSVEPAQSA